MKLCTSTWVDRYAIATCIRARMDACMRACVQDALSLSVTSAGAHCTPVHPRIPWVALLV